MWLLKLLDDLYHWSNHKLPLRWACDRYDDYLLSPTGTYFGSWELRCPVCEGLDYPGLIHNTAAPYCVEYRPWIPTPHEVQQLRNDLDVALRKMSDG